MLPAVFADPAIGIARFPPGVYLLGGATAVSVTMPGVIFWPHGIDALGATFTPTFNDVTKDAIRFTSTDVTRFFILRGFKIKCQGKSVPRERHGLFLEVPLTGDHIYNFSIQDVIIEGAGADGCKIEGNIFEGEVRRLVVRGNKNNGLTMGHHASGGALSSIDVYSLITADNDVAGVSLTLNANDVYIHSMHAIQNGTYAVLCSNGIRKVTGHFENNHRLAADQLIASGWGAVSTTAGLLEGCYQLNTNTIGRTTHLLRTFPANKVSVHKSVSSGSTSDGNCQLAHVSSAMNAGTMLDIANSDGTRSTTMRTNMGSGIVRDEGSVYPYVPSAPTDAGTTTIPNNPNDRNVLLRPAGTIAAHTVNLPSSPRHGQELRINTTQQITALTFSPAVTGFANGSQLSANTSLVVQFENATWYRVN